MCYFDFFLKQQFYNLQTTMCVCVQLGLESVGVEDLASGLVTGGFYLGQTLGPLLGGAATSLLGFPWAATIMAGMFVVQSGLLAVVVTCTKLHVQSYLQALDLPVVTLS